MSKDPKEAASDQSIDWLRHASPYIQTHRGKTFVLYFSGEVMASVNFATLIQDITLLQTLGIRLVLVHGLRPQIDLNLGKAEVLSRFHNGIRITDDSALAAVQNEVGLARINIESTFSTGRPNTPKSSAHISIASGNFVTAQPMGVLDGIDLCHTGIVRQVHSNTINRQLDNGQLVLLSPLGYSRTGEIFNLQGEEVATKAAISLGAEKLIFMTDHTITLKDGTALRETTPSELVRVLPSLQISDAGHRIVCRAAEACKANVKRAHILDHTDDDALLKELFTRDGFGAMISADAYETIRSATIQDVGGIIDLIEPLEKDGTLVKRSREQLELDIDKFLVVDRDGTVIACAALLPYQDAQQMDFPEPEGQNSGLGEIACMVTHPQYRNRGHAETLLNQLERRALQTGINTIVALTTRTNHWFLEQGFTPTTNQILPQDHRATIQGFSAGETLETTERNSKVLQKSLRNTTVM